MRINHRWWLVLVWTSMAAGCPINCKSKEGSGSGVGQIAAKGLNIHNCTQYQVGVFWTVGINPDWDNASSQTIEPPSGECRAGDYIDFEDGVTYTVRYRRNQGDCAANEGESNEFEPKDCSPHGVDRTYVGDDDEPVKIVEVKL